MSTDYQAMAAAILEKARKKAEASNDHDNLILQSQELTLPEAKSLFPEPKIEIDSSQKIIVALDSMQLGFIQSCLRKYHLRHNLLIDSREHSQGINKGILGHEFLRFYYIARRANETIKQAREEGITHGRKKIPELDLEDDAITDVTRKFIEYTNVYSGETYEIIDVEQPFSVDLYEDDGLIIVWEGIIDLFAKHGAEFLVVDHKTGSRKDYWDPLHNQLVGYATVKGTKLVMINEVIFVKGVNEGFHRSPLTMTAEITNLFRESTVASVKNYLAYAAANYYPPNMHSCNSGKFGCSFRDFCKADVRTQEWLMKTQYKYTTKWDPFQRG